jgi:DNA polymerase
MGRIVLIGEAPGHGEEETGKPFMGIAGQALDKWLQELSLEDKVYITNICKCRPPYNRKPTTIEADTCAQRYLTEELHIIEPKVVVCLGRTAINYLFKGGPFERGVAHRWIFNSTDIWVIPTWHPSYFNRLGGESSKKGSDIRSQVISSLSRAKEIAYGPAKFDS